MHVSIVNHIPKDTFDGCLELTDISFVCPSHSDLPIIEGLSLKIEIGLISIC